MRKIMVLVVFALLQGCDGSSVITAEQWQVANSKCESHGGPDIVKRYFGRHFATIQCKNGAIFPGVEVPVTRFTYY